MDGHCVAAEAAAKAAWYTQRRAYRQLRHQKSKDFWQQQIENNRSSPRLLWQTVDKIMGRSKPQSCDDIDVEQFSRFFADKVARVRQSTENAPPPTLYSCS